MAMWQQHGIPSGDALHLLSHLTNKSRAEAYVIEEKDLPDDVRRAFFDACERRAAGEPLQYILSEWDFYGLRFKVDKRALIPRPETEIMVEMIINDTKMRKDEKIRILDVCTGNGCIAVTLAKVLEQEAGNIVATDICADALELARENASLHGVGERIHFVQGNMAENIRGEFDIIVSNPPYIPTAQLDTLQHEVRVHEPRLALDGGADGMDLYRRLLPRARGLLRRNGRLYLEIGPAAVARLAREAGFNDVQVTNDYAGLPRIVTGRGD